MTDLDALVRRLDTADKVRLLTGATLFTLHAEERIGLHPMAFSDGPTGVRGLEFSGGALTCLLPNATLIASSWSVETAQEVGRLLAEEAARQRIHVVLGPTINLHRSPLGGRLFESYSEDPLLTGRLAAAYVRGLQDAGIGACLKHLVANEAETERHTVNNVVDERTLRELYLLPFEIAIKDADPWSVMAAYNDVNGSPATEQDDINNGILKDEWGWPGLVMSDWFATKSAAPAANGGLDLVMPGPEGPWGDALVGAVESGEVAPAVLDDHVRRLLLLADRVGALGSPRSWSRVPSPDSPVRRDQLTRLAASGMTVLRNEGALPLGREQTVALIGRLAIETTCMGGGSAKVRAPYEVSVEEGLISRWAGAVKVTDGVDVRRRPRPARSGYLRDPETGAVGVRARLYDSSGTVLSDSVYDQNVLLYGLGGGHEKVVRAELRALLPPGAQRIGVVGIGEWAFNVDTRTATASVAAETDDVGESVLRPPGRTIDVVLDEETELVAAVALPDSGHGALGLAAEPTPASDDDAIAAAVRAARAADVAVVVVGLTEEEETEALDKATLVLPGRQDDLVSAVAAAASRTVVVVNAATPILMPWRDDVDAILVAGIPGQEGGHAVAAALLNEIEPAGRLVTTWPTADGATPAWDVVPVNGVLAYAEGPFIGYRGHAAGVAPAPAFWFGEGLGYGSWEYAGAALNGRTVTVSLRNVGELDSREVVQVYYDPQDAAQPVRLVGWSTVQVAAGSTAAVPIPCDERLWRTWEAATSSWRVLTGGRLLIARCLGDVRLEVPA